MPIFDRIHDLLDRVRTYPLAEVLVELVVIFVIVYVVVRFVQGTRAAGIVKGTLVVLIFAGAARVLGGVGAFPRLAYLYDRFLALVAIGLVAVFQPELRRALVRISEAAAFRSTPKEMLRLIDAVSDACAYLSKAKFGAIIVIERTIPVRGTGDGGTTLDAAVTARLLQTIFFPGSALHDLAVIIRGGKVAAAGVQLPLADASDMADPGLGSRHRAAVGLSKECDAVVVVVSEETGAVRLALRGRLGAPLPIPELRDTLRRLLARSRRNAAGAEPAEQEARLSA